MVFHGFWLVSMVFKGGFMVFHGFWLVSMVFQGGFMVFHGFWLVSMFFQGGFMVFHGFWVYLPELYPDPTIQSRSATRRAAQHLVFSNSSLQRVCILRKEMFFKREHNVKSVSSALFINHL